MQGQVNVPMAGEAWDGFRRSLREFYETATGETLCSGRPERFAGVGTIKKIVGKRGYLLEGERKTYTLKREARECFT